MKILIIDDQELVLIALDKCLTDLGYEVLSATTVSEGIKKYDMFLPDMVISDMNISFLSNDERMDFPSTVNDNPGGLEIVKYIKMIKHHSIPVMFMIRNINVDLILKGFDLGVSDYIKKPFKISEIGAKVKRLFGSANDDFRLATLMN